MPDLEQIEGVSNVNVGGSVTPAIEVAVDPHLLTSAGFTLNDIVSTILANNNREPGGIAYLPNHETTIDVRGDVTQRRERCKPADPGGLAVHVNVRQRDLQPARARRARRAGEPHRRRAAVRARSPHRARRRPRPVRLRRVNACGRGARADSVRRTGAHALAVRNRYRRRDGDCDAVALTDFGCDAARSPERPPGAGVGYGSAGLGKRRRPRTRRPRRVRCTAEPR